LNWTMRARRVDRSRVDGRALARRRALQVTMEGNRRMLRYVKKFEQLIVRTLIVLMVLVVLFSTIELAWVIVEEAVSPPLFRIDIERLLDLFGLFLLVLIGIELLETIRAYATENIVHVKVVVTVAIIAIARKVIILDFSKTTGIILLGMAAMLVALSVAHLCLSDVFKRMRKDRSDG